MATTIQAPGGVSLTTAYQTILTVPAGRKYLVEVILTNIDGAAIPTATVDWLDASNANAVNPMCYLADVPKKDVTILPRKTLDAGDTIRALASAVGDVFASVNVLMDIDA